MKVYRIALGVVLMAAGAAFAGDESTTMDPSLDPAIGGSGEPQMQEPLRDPLAEPAEKQPLIEERTGTITISPAPMVATETTTTTTKTEESKSSIAKTVDRFSVMAGGGFEGYAGVLNDRIAAGPAWGVTLGTQPLPFLGAELGYTGAANEVSNNLAPQDNGVTNGADIVRNGGQAAVTVSAPTPYVQPYALAGLGIDRYTIRGDGEALGFSDDTSGRVPLGGGVRTRVGAFTADARINYDVLFDQDFARQSAEIGGAYTGMFSIGGRF